MAAPETQVKESDLIKAVELIETAATEIRGIQSRLDNAGVTLKAHWVGDSHRAFDAVHLKWHERMDVILQSLNRLAEHVGSSNKNFAQFNQERVEATNHIANMINAASPVA